MHLLNRVTVFTRATCIHASPPFYWRVDTDPVSTTPSITNCLNIQKFTGTPEDAWLQMENPTSIEHV